MKYFLLIVCSIIGDFSFAQKQETIYNTKIDKTNTVEIKGGVTNIKKADTVLISIYTDIKSKVYLDGVKQIKDTSGIYVTTIFIKNPYSQTLDFTIDLFFDNPVLEVETNGMIGMIQTLQDSIKVWWTLIGSSLYTLNNGYGEIIVKSKMPIKFGIKGLLDMLKN